MSSVRTPNGILSFPNLFVAKPQVAGGDPRFSLNLILDKAAQATDAYKQLRALVADAIDDKWGQGKSKDAEWIRRTKLRLPFRPCADRDYAGYDVDGGVFISPWSKNKPGIVDKDLNDIMVPGDVYSGQLVRCTVHAFSYDTQGNKGVSFNLNNVQIVKADMPRLDGRRNAKDEFDRLGDPEAGDASSPFDDASDPPF